jgi:hypothetical protein
MQAQLQQLSVTLAEMQGRFERLLFEKQGKVIDHDYKVAIHGFRAFKTGGPTRHAYNAFQ